VSGGEWDNRRNIDKDISKRFYLYLILYLSLRRKWSIARYALYLGVANMNGITFKMVKLAKYLGHIRKVAQFFSGLKGFRASR
jgi:hypothetical protein